jgi:hypothetical protein
MHRPTQKTTVIPAQAGMTGSIVESVTSFKSWYDLSPDS